MDELNGRMIACQILITGLIARVANNSKDPLSFLTDFRDEICTSVFDAEAGIALDSTFVKVVSWYDNEWGYSCKVLEMVRVAAK